MSAIKIQHSLECFPADLSKQVGKTKLMRMVFEAVDATRWTRPLPVNPNGMPEPVLRTLVTFCFSAGVFGSREIEESARLDGSIRYLCANDFPTWEEVRQFRRANISHLREALARTLRASAEEVGQTMSESFFPYLAEADRRLRLAVEADSAAMDD